MKDRSFKIWIKMTEALGYKNKKLSKYHFHVYLLFTQIISVIIECHNIVDVDRMVSVKLTLKRTLNGPLCTYLLQADNLIHSHQPISITFQRIQHICLYKLTCNLMDTYEFHSQVSKTDFLTNFSKCLSIN